MKTQTTVTNLPSAFVKILTASLFLFTGLPELNAQTPGTWEWQNPSPHGNQINAITFYNDELGWAAAAGGIIMRTTNGGTDWETYDTGSTNPVNAIFFVDEQTGWTGGLAGEIMHTTDGGASWEHQASMANGGVRDFHFIDGQTGWAVGSNNSIYTTNDAGETWTAYDGIDVDLSGFARIAYRSVSFDGAGNGIMVGRISSNNNLIFHTHDGGDTWEETFSLDTYYRAQFVAEATAYIAGVDGLVRKTTDAGETWTTRKLELSRAPTLWDMHFVDEQTGWVTGSSGQIFKTTDGGQTWTDQRPDDNRETNWAVFALDSDRVWTGGGMGHLMHSEDGGDTWGNYASYEVIPPSTINAIHFSDEDTGWMGAQVGSSWSPFHLLYTTADGGETWQEHDVLELDFRVHSINFAEVDYGWIAGRDGRILHTDDGGDTWQEQDSGTEEHLNAIFFHDAETGWAVGDNSTVLHTLDGGNTWQEQSAGNTDDLNDIMFIDAQTGWLVGDDGVIRRTSDGGETWQSSNSGTSLDLNAVDFADERNGLAVGRSGIVLRTTNGGSSWINRRIPGVRIWNDIHLIDEQRAWAVEADGFILYTDNFGDSWSSASTRSDGSLNSLFITASGEGWAAGRDGVVLRNPDAASVPTSTIVDERIVPQGITLQQNYPNPFNPTTNITFELDLTADVTLRVYDITGRLVSELANGRFSQGVHTISFDAAHLSSGVYIYQLQAAGAVHSGKMTLMK